MKKTLLLILLFVSGYCSAQFNLEHTYAEGTVNRIKLEYSGEKYFLFKYATKELKLFNADHTPWKTIAFPTGTNNILHISEAVFNPDSNLEIVYSYYDAALGMSKSGIISEDGSVLLEVLNCSDLRLNEIPGLPDKMIAQMNGGGAKVFSVPELTLEHSYAESRMQRIKLETSGEKYFAIDQLNNTVNVYNNNHSLWKTVSIPRPTNAFYFLSTITLFENSINGDAGLKVFYSYNVNSLREAKIVDENNAVLLTVTDGVYCDLSILDGSENKLLVAREVQTAPGVSLLSTNVYHLPSLALEFAYPTEMKRMKMELSGEKYLTCLNPPDANAKIYNSDHTLWKSIPLPLPDASYKAREIYVSETTLNNDALIEVIYSGVTGSLFSPQYVSTIMNENGLVYLSVPDAAFLDVSVLPGFDNKVLGYISPLGSSSYGTVYSAPVLAVKGFNTDNVLIAPNPAKNYINLQSKTAIVDANVFDMRGILVVKSNAANIKTLNIENLSAGMYLLHLTDSNGEKSVSKILVSR